jgi:hypothetical protein
MALCRHVHASVVSRRVMGRSSGCIPVDRRGRGYSGVARSAAGYRRIAARGRALRHCQRSATDEQRDDRKTFHAGHFHLQCLSRAHPDVHRERLYEVVRSGGSPPRLILENRHMQLLPVVVTHDKAGGLDGPGWREAAGGHSAVLRM